MRNNDVNFTFRRSFGLREETKWESLTNILDGITMNQQDDSTMWVQEKSKKYSTSLYTMYLLFWELRIDG
jgi:hypothetical protein